MASPRTNTNNCVDNVNITAEIFDEYGDFIRAVISYKAKDKSLADDIFQDFFLALVYKPIPKGTQNVKSYLYRAITNDIIDCTRRVRRYQEYMHKYGENFNCSINKSSPENALIEAEETNKMFKLIEGRLPHSEAQAITLRYRNDYNIEEIGKKMDVNSRSVSRYISVGFRKIRQLFTAK